MPHQKKKTKISLQNHGLIFINKPHANHLFLCLPHQIMAISLQEMQPRRQAPVAAASRNRAPRRRQPIDSQSHSTKPPPIPTGPA